MPWHQIFVAMECDEEWFAALFDGSANYAIGEGEKVGVDVHVSGERSQPDWMTASSDCDVPDCNFPAEWVVEVAANGSVTEFRACGAHRHEVAAAASTCYATAWGDAEILVKEL